MKKYIVVDLDFSNYYYDPYIVFIKCDTLTKAQEQAKKAHYHSIILDNEFNEYEAYGEY